MNELCHQLILNLSEKLLNSHSRLVTAESCTGGGVAYYLTNIAGSSRWFERGFVTYSNQAKIECINVPPSTLEHCGAVSEETARCMAEGALRMSHAEVSLAITGIAGPEGGTSDKPIGTIWIAYASQFGNTHSFISHLEGSRIAIREQTIIIAIKKLIAYLDTHGIK